MALLVGYLVGLAMVVFIGPVVFTLLKSTLHQGRAAGMMVALGIIVSDIVVVAICTMGAARYVQDTNNLFYIGLVGAFILFGIGVRYLIKPAEIHLEEKQSYTKLARHFAKGFLVNGVNPFVFGVWLYVISQAGKEYGYGTELYLFLGACLAGIFTTDTLKVLLSHKLQKLIQPERLRRIYRVFGVLLIGFGFRILFEIF